MRGRSLRWFWWIYLIVISLDVFAAPFLYSQSLEGWLNSLFVSVGLLGLLGFLREKMYGSRKFWRHYFFLFLLYYISSVAYSLVTRKYDLTIYGVVFGAILALPLFVALWCYAFLDSRAYGCRLNDDCKE